MGRGTGRLRGIARDGETADACFGLAAACGGWARTRPASPRCTRAYALFRRRATSQPAVQCAVWLAITYKANFANFAAANGWIGRADRLLEAIDPGPLHGWVWVARAYRMADLERRRGAHASGPLDVARATGDVDLELVALSQLGLIRVGKGETEAGLRPDRRGDGGRAGRRAHEPRHGRLRLLRHAQRLRAGERRRTGRAVVPGGRRLRRDLRLPVPVRRVPHLLRQRARRQGALGRRRARAGGRAADHRRHVSRAARPGAARRLAALRMRQGRLEEAEQLLAGVGAGIDASRPRRALSRGRAAAGAGRRGGGQPAPRAPAAPAATSTARTSPRRSTCSSTPTSPPATSTPPRAAADRLADGRRPTDSDGLTRRAGRGAGAGCRCRPGDAEQRGRRIWRPPCARWSRPGFPFEAARARFELARVLAAGQPRRRHRPRPAGAGHVRRARRRARRRPGGGLPPLARRRRPAGPQGRRDAHRTGAGGAAAPRRRAVQPRDRGAAPRQPQDRLPPRQQHPHQARPAQPGRGRGLRGRVRPSRRRTDAIRERMGQLPDARRARRSMIGP